MGNRIVASAPRLLASISTIYDALKDLYLQLCNIGF